MGIIVTDTGFRADTWSGEYLAPQDLAAAQGATGLGLRIPCSADPAAFRVHLPRIAMICVRFSHFHEARGFALARRLRAMGYRGQLRAQGHVLAFHYTLARRAGFDEVEISAALALRQPAEHWRFLGNWRHEEFRSTMPA